VREAGVALARAWPAFDRERFERLALDGLDALAMKARADHIATALEDTLPADFGTAAALLEATLAPAQPAADGLGDAATAADSDAGPDPGREPDHPAGLRGWIIWPMGVVVERRGLAEPERALDCLHALTQRLSAEWALRPFLEHHPALTWARLARWVDDPSEHVRRLVSEGSRPRLPWGRVLTASVVDPSPAYPLLRRLQDDPSPYVRRSVANHLNDIARDHPGRLVDWLAEHLPGASPPRRALLRHASRTLIKQGHPAVLALWGAGRPLQGTAALRLAPARLHFGGTLQLTVSLTAPRTAPQQDLVIDIGVHHRKADGRLTLKVFKGWARSLAPGTALTLHKALPMRPISTRRYHDGEHRVDLRINGQVTAEARFELTGASVTG
jgi:3-methyladenine DNA glycosylase AlkC